MNEAILYKKLKKGAVQCQACNNYCVIPKGKAGICGVRKNIDEKLELLVYGKPVVLNIDPIEKKPLYHFLPGTEILSLGTFGCNFRCLFCQNFGISQTYADKTQTDTNNTTEYIHRQADTDVKPKEIVDIALKNKIPSIAYTYNEPTIFAEYAVDIMKIAKKNKIKNVFVSNGYQSKECIKLISDYLDAINIDLKSFSDDFYQKICGARLQPVLDNIKKFYETGVWIEITTLLIPNENDSTEELERLAEFISKISFDIPWHISRFFPMYKMNNKTITSYNSLLKAYEIGKRAGLKYVYIGNVGGTEYERTVCPGCGEILIQRDGISGLWNNLDQDRCADCGIKIAGVFE